MNYISNQDHERKEETTIVNTGRGRLFRRKDDKYLIYIPKDLAEDSMFPLKCSDAIHVKISFKPGEKKLLIEKWKKQKKSPENKHNKTIKHIPATKNTQEKTKDTSLRQ